LKFPVSVLLCLELVGSAWAAQEPVAIDPEPMHLALADCDGIAGLEWIRVQGASLELTTEGGQTLRSRFPGDAVLWTVADLDRDGHGELLALVGGDRLYRLVVAGDGLDWKLIRDGLGNPKGLPRGVRSGPFIRDVDGDGFLDLVIPDEARVRLFFGGAEGLRAGPSLEVATRLALDVGGPMPRGLLHRVRRRLRVPEVHLQDISGDGRGDLLVADGDRIREYIAGAKGLPDQPTATVDLSLFSARLPKLRFDPSNVAGLTRYAVWENWDDLNGDGALDLIVLAGGNVLVYLGGPKGVDLHRPSDQLPTRGNILYALSAPIDGDAIPDLVLIRIEDISLARVLSWAVFSFSLKLDILAYHGNGKGRFSKRPLPQSRSLKIRSPSILSLLRNKDEADSLRRTVVRLADFDGDGRATDLVVLDASGALAGWRNLVSDPSLLDHVTAHFLRQLLAQRENLDLDVETLAGWLLGRASLLVSLTHGKEPSFRIPAPAGWRIPQAMTVSDVDGDGRDEILVLHRILLDSGGDVHAGLQGYLYDPDQPTRSQRAFK